MLKTNTTLVLGAGASIAMGYPTGAGLRSKILELTSGERMEFSIRAGLMTSTNPSLYELVDAFRKSQMYSIDAFLSRRPEFTDIGKMAIAAVLLECEKTALLDSCEHPDGWLQYLWNQFGAANWDELDFSSLRIVTFNYDRVLEHYLLQAIQYAHGKTQNEALSKLASLQVVHVYGSLGATLPNRAGYLNYGYGIENGAPAIVAKSLQVIPEGRNDSATITAARGHLIWANRIGFLGFGFDSLNMERLASDETCKRTIHREGSIAARPVHATSLGLTESEREAAKNQMGTNNSVDPRFYACDCLSMLRESALLR